MMYSQRDPAWSAKHLGKSGLTMGGYGCLVTDIAQGLTLAGYSVTPGQLCDSLNAHNGFTPDGLVIWGVIAQLYPQFHLGGQGYTFVQGTFGKVLHFVLLHAGVTYEPWYGVNNLPSGWHNTGYTRTAAIDPAPQQPTNQGGTVTQDQKDVEKVHALFELLWQKHPTDQQLADYLAHYHGILNTGKSEEQAWHQIYLENKDSALS